MRRASAPELVPSRIHGAEVKGSSGGGSFRRKREPSLRFLVRRLRTPTAPSGGGGMSGADDCSSLIIGEVCLMGSAPCVGVRDSQSRAFPVCNHIATLIANPDSLTRHYFLPFGLR
jgi:hypothetical protein